MDFSPFSKRRARLMNHMGRGIAVIPTAPKTIADIEPLMRESRHV